MNATSRGGSKNWIIIITEDYSALYPVLSLVFPFASKYKNDYAFLKRIIMSVLSRVPNDALHGTPTHNMPVRQTGIQYGKSGVLGKRITRMYMIIHSTLSGVFF